MAQSPEQELAEFIAPLPQSLQKILWHDHSSMTDLEWAEWVHSKSPFTADQLQELKATTGWQPQTYPRTADELRPGFEAILRRCDRAEWKRYCDNARAARRADADSHVLMPRGEPGRKPNDELAERIWALTDAGNTSREIQTALKNDGINLSQDGIESYRKTRRRPRKQ